MFPRRLLLMVSNEPDGASATSPYSVRLFPGSATITKIGMSATVIGKVGVGAAKISPRSE